MVKKKEKKRGIRTSTQVHPVQRNRGADQKANEREERTRAQGEKRGQRVHFKRHRPSTMKKREGKSARRKQRDRRCSSSNKEKETQITCTTKEEREQGHAKFISLSNKKKKRRPL